MILQWAMHFASGNSLFSGALLLLATVGTVTLTSARKYRRSWRFALLVAILLIALSATPFPWWAYSLWIVLLVGWLWTLRRENPLSLRKTRVWGAGLSGVTLILIAAEVATLFPKIHSNNHQTMYVIGDSITAGLNDDDLLWPTILADERNVDVVNLAQPGAMADSALKQAARIPADAAGIVLIEIGGNDLLSGRTSEVFCDDLRRLIEQVQRPNRTLVMMELPLPPFSNAFGRVQRQIADQYGVPLISKREFAKVLGRADGTLDGIHLSESGQRLMAQIVWKHVSPSYGSTTTVAADQ